MIMIKLLEVDKKMAYKEFRKTTKSGLDVRVRKTKDYPFCNDTKKKYHVLVDDGNNYFMEGFDSREKAMIYARNVK